MILLHNIIISDNLIKLFNKKIYERHVLNIMNLSNLIFPAHYQSIDAQAHGECDYIDISNTTKYDAKLPFLPKQVELLTSGRQHAPQILEWIKEMYDEAADYNPIETRSNPKYNVIDTKLGKIIKNAIQNDNIDENIIFFIPFPITLSVEDIIFLQFDFESRSIFVIYPSSRKNNFAISNLKYHHTEFIDYGEMEQYFSYEIIG